MGTKEPGSPHKHGLKSAWSSSHQPTISQLQWDTGLASGCAHLSRVCNPRQDAHFPPVLGQDFTPKSRISHLCLIHSILAHWLHAQGTRLSRWFERGSAVPSLCFVSDFRASVKVMNSSPCNVCSQEATEWVSGVWAWDQQTQVQILAHLSLCMCDLQHCLFSLAFSFSSGRWG